MAHLPRCECYKRRWSSLKSERSTFFGHWQELSEYIVPRRGRFLASDVNKGTKKNSKIIDSTATMALRTLSAGMMSGITSPARPWFRLSTPDPELVESADVKQWLYIVERRMRDIFSRSNLYNALQTVYEEMGVFGTGAILVEEDDADVIRCYPFTAGEYAIALSDRLEVNTFYREFRLTVAQVVEWFGIEKCSNTVTTMFRNKNLDKWVDIIHVIEPNVNGESGMSDNLNMPYVSVYFEKGDASQFLSDSGYEEFPIMAPRWHVNGADIWGRSPGMDVLGDVKALQVEQKRKAQGIDKMVNPPMVAPHSMRGQTASVLPGGVTYIDMTPGTPGFRPVYEVNPRLAELQQDIVETQDRIRQGFYADLFQMLTHSTRRQITAREVEERHEEKLLMLGPVLERLHSELLDPLIDRTFAIMVRQQMIPPPPEILGGVDLKVEYVSVLAQAQRLVGTGAIERLAGFVGNLAAANPEALDKLDMDQSVDEYADMLGVPPKMVVSDEQVQKIRAARAQQMQRQQQMESLQQGIESAKTASETNTEEGNLLSQVMSGEMPPGLPGAGGEVPGV